MVSDLRDLSDANWARVAGRDVNLPPHVNGHDEFAGSWTRLMLAALHGLPLALMRQPFETPGFPHLPATRPGENVVVTVPGTVHPEQAVVAVAHYDGEPTSHGSAFDDASGCVILLGLARSLGTLWRAHGLPALTVQFVLFDAEEQGLVGSDAFRYNLQHGALAPRPALLINEEQNGVGYPVRPFGHRQARPLSTYADTLSRLSPRLRQIFGPFAPVNRRAHALLTRRLITARTHVFAQLHAVYGSIPFEGGHGAVFAPGERSRLEIGDMPLCCSDDVPFQALGVPTVTFAGNSDYYDRNAPHWAFPFDQPDDTFAALACDTGGSPAAGPALAAALELPAALSLNLVEVYAPPHAGSGLAVVSSLPDPGGEVHFQVAARGQVQWRFGDGTGAGGRDVRHHFSHPGHYILTVRAGGVSRSLGITVPSHAQTFEPHLKAGPPPLKAWHPPELAGVAGCP